jgi:hypothetical protein
LIAITRSHLVAADISRFDTVLHDACVVERRIQVPEAGHGSFDQGRHLTVIAHIAANSESLTTGGFEVRCLGTHRFLLDVRQHH